VKAGKAYMSSLGTTGLLIASSVLLLLVVGTILAFDRWPDGEPAGTEVVAVDLPGRPASAGTVSTALARAARRVTAERRRAAASLRRRARARAAAANHDHRPTGPGAELVISDLPAPDSDATAGGPATGGGPVTDGQSTRQDGGGSAAGGRADDGHLGDPVSGVNQQAGTALGGVGTAVGEAVGGTAPSLSP
jgi:hypothetical protein